MFCSILFSNLSAVISLLSKNSLELFIFLYPSIVTLIFDFAPFVSKNSLDKSTILLLFHTITSLFSSVITATSVASKFSLSAYSKNLSLSFLSMTTAILSCDSDIASSVPFNPIYLTGTLFKSIISPSANSPIATDTPPAPKSLHFFINLVTSLFLNNLCIFLSVIAFPFCTSAAHCSVDFSVCSFDDPVAPPIPSLPVLPPSNITTSSFSGLSLLIFSAGAAPTTTPSSILLAL